VIIVNKRPSNLFTETQNVFINGKQVKTAKIAQIIPWFSRYYGTKTTGNSQRRYRPHAWNSDLSTVSTAANSLTVRDWVFVLQTSF